MILDIFSSHISQGTMYYLAMLIPLLLVTAESGGDFSEDAISLRISGLVRKPYEIGDIRNEFENLRYPVRIT